MRDPIIITIVDRGDEFAVQRSDRPAPERGSYRYRRHAIEAARSLAMRTGGRFVEPTTGPRGGPGRAA